MDAPLRCVGIAPPPDVVAAGESGSASEGSCSLELHMNASQVEFFWWVGGCDGPSIFISFIYIHTHYRSEEFNFVFIDYRSISLSSPPLEVAVSVSRKNKVFQVPLCLYSTMMLSKCKMILPLSIPIHVSHHVWFRRLSIGKSPV